MIDFEPIDLHQREWTEHPSEHEEHEPFADHVKIVVAITEEGEAHVVSWHPYCRGVDEELANIGPSEMFSHDPAEWPESLRVREFPTSEVAL